MAYFDDMAMAVASFGAKNKIIYDDIGMPSIMVAVPKMKYSDVVTKGSAETIPWWIMDGVEKDVIWVSKYTNIVKNERAYSLPAESPMVGVTFDQALQLCRNKGNGWHLNQNGVFACLNLLAQKNNLLPRGNTFFDKSFEQQYERGINTYRQNSMANGGRIAAGTGPATWYTEHSTAGIADLCGNCWEWVSGFRIMDGEIQIIPDGSVMRPDCDVSEASTAWKAVKPDGSIVEPGTLDTMKYNGDSTTIKLDTMTSPEQRMCQAAFGTVEPQFRLNIPGIITASGVIRDNSQNVYGNSGHLQKVDLQGERLPIRGSNYDSGGNGGIASMYVNQTRTSSTEIGFRAAYVDL